MTNIREPNLKHDIADSLNPIAVSLGYLEKLIEAGRTDEALHVLREVMQPAMERARATLAQNVVDDEAVSTKPE